MLTSLMPLPARADDVEEITINSHNTLAINESVVFHVSIYTLGSLPNEYGNRCRCNAPVNFAHARVVPSRCFYRSAAFLPL